MRKLVGQKGMTLVEVIIGTAIAGAITAGLGLAIFNLVTVTDRGNSETNALHDLQNAVYWISLDAKMAASTDLVEDNPPTDSLRLDWVDGGGNAHYSDYYLSGTQLIRDHDSIVTTAARYITTLQFTVSGSNLNYYIESAPQGYSDVSEAFTGTVFFRPTT